MRLLLTRPRNESEALGHRLEGLGHDVLIEPLLSIKTMPQAKIDCTNPQAIIITSVNGARTFSDHANAHLYEDVAIFAVGTATADALGRFNVVHRGNGGVAALTDIIRTRLKPDGGPLIYIRGVHVAGDLARDLMTSGYKLEQVVIYEAVETAALSPAVIDAFCNNLVGGVVLFSPRTATTFRRLAEKARLAKKLDGVTFYCLSQNVSDSIGLGERQVVIAAQPTLTSLIDAIGGS